MTPIRLAMAAVVWPAPQASGIVVRCTIESANEREVAMRFRC
jgi:hypothetical protein